MRKVSFLLIAVLIMVSFTCVFAEDFEAPADVKGTKYEDAVKGLMVKDLISGYTDGTYRPDSTISRAEACAIIVRALNPSEENLKSISGNHFPDLSGYVWAAKYINYAAAKDIISGYPNGDFRPANPVSYEEMASMIIRAMGYTADELNGVWPDNYLVKATELGIFKGVDFGVGDPALRGNVALMIYTVADNILDGTKPEETEEPGEQEPGTEPIDSFLEFSGRAYGILMEVAKLMNEKGDVVDEYEFLLGKGTRYIQTNGRVIASTPTIIKNHLNAGDLYGLQMNNGIITKFGTSNDEFADINKPKGFENFTDSWTKVLEAKNNTVKIDKPYKGRDTLTILEEASVYVSKEDGDTITGYEPGTIRDIQKGNYVRLYCVTGETPGVVEIVLVRTKIPTD